MEGPARSDAERWLASARTGDLAGLDRLLASQRSELLAAVRAMVGRRLAARVEPEDLFQEATLQAMRSITTLRTSEPSVFRRWFLGIARHRALGWVDAGRARKRPRRTTPLPDAHILFQDPSKLDPLHVASPVSPGATEATRSRAGVRLRRTFADGRLSMLLHEIFESGWDTVAFLLDRPTREAARQVHVRVRGR